MSPEALFWSLVDKSGECWTWTGKCNPEGYGYFSGGKGSGWRITVRAHRFAWELLRGSIPDGLVLDHLCRNHVCVNPDHLEPVDQRTNILRGVGITAQNAAKTHCKRGHPFTPENTIPRDLGRECRACKRIHGRAHDAKRRAAAC